MFLRILTALIKTCTLTQGPVPRHATNTICVYFCTFWSIDFPFQGTSSSPYFCLIESLIPQSFLGKDYNHQIAHSICSPDCCISLRRICILLLFQRQDTKPLLCISANTKLRHSKQSSISYSLTADPQLYSFPYSNYLQG